MSTRISALVDWFTAASHPAEHVEDVHGKATDDVAIAAYTKSHDAVIVSKDFDFVDILVGEGAPRLLWIRTGNTRTAALLERLETEWLRILDDLQNLNVVELG